jgi:hypothetical protein
VRNVMAAFHLLFWWEFLCRHEGYKDCCARGGAGRYKKLYAHFGDVHAYETKDFWSWWTEKLDNDWKRSEFLFAEPDARQMAVQGKVFNTLPDDMLVLSIPLEVRTPQLVKKLRSLAQYQRRCICGSICHNRL